MKAIRRNYQSDITLDDVIKASNCQKLLQLNWEIEEAKLNKLVLIAFEEKEKKCLQMADSDYHLFKKLLVDRDIPALEQDVECLVESHDSELEDLATADEQLFQMSSISLLATKYISNRFPQNSSDTENEPGEEEQYNSDHSNNGSYSDNDEVKGNNFSAPENKKTTHLPFQVEHCPRGWTDGPAAQFHYQQAKAQPRKKRFPAWTQFQSQPQWAASRHSTQLLGDRATTPDQYQVQMNPSLQQQPQQYQLLAPQQYHHRLQDPQQYELPAQRQYQYPQQYELPAQRQYQDPQQYEPPPQPQYQAPQQYELPPQPQYQAPQQYELPPQPQYQVPQQYEPPLQQHQLQYQAPQQYEPPP
ncbi:hypothetical protein F4604DRAFT_1685353 [Suillus subluteus]|nr:hypothetical protein F4604DRAFT_1685353 [Suillus subluteus]